MQKIGLLRGILLCSKYKKLNEEQRKLSQHERLQALVSWSRNNSPFYKELYQNVKAPFSLTDLPIVNKKQLMEHFDDWITDSSIKLHDIEAFMNNLDNIGRKFKDKYLIFTTSGSTGNPLVAVCDDTTNNLMGAINVTRSFARKKDMKAFLLHGSKSIGVFATGGFYLANSSIRYRLHKMPWKKSKIGITSALLPIEQIVAKLNEFQPAMLGGYPSNLELLIEEQKMGRLQIHPTIIMTGGEYLSNDLRNKLAYCFGCYVQTNYSCTEGGTIACECSEGHLHINDDWIIVEPVDNDNNPVGEGILSDKILITNLFNYTQPFIRYEVTDRVIMHDDICSCKNPSPWLTLEGRSDDVVEFTQDKKTIRLPPLAIYAVLKEIHSLRRFQLIVAQNNNLELRIEPIKDFDKNTAFLLAKESLKSLLNSHGVINFTINLSKSNPMPHPKSGKFKHIIYNENSSIHVPPDEVTN